VGTLQFPVDSIPGATGVQFIPDSKERAQTKGKLAISIDAVDRFPSYAVPTVPLSMSMGTESEHPIRRAKATVADSIRLSSSTLLALGASTIRMNRWRRFRGALVYSIHSS
jgi:hypothetical protein